MGKEKDRGLDAGSKTPASTGRPSGKPSRFAPFLANLIKFDLYKPNQGKKARWLTVAGLGLVIAIGLWRMFEVMDTVRTYTRYGIVTVIGAVCSWLIFRIVNYVPFADFLIATEAEMRKVSWTTSEDLKRATSVVLCTVLLMTVFLFSVDRVWSILLGLIGVLRVGDASMLGEGAG